MRRRAEFGIRMRQQRRKNDRAEPLLAPLDYEIERSGRRTQAFLAALLAFVIFVIVVLAVAPVRETAVAQGVIATEAETVEVRHVSGGSVASVHVRDGDRVERDRLLLEIDGFERRNGLARLRAREGQLRLTAARYAALLTGATRMETPIGAELDTMSLMSSLALFDAERASLIADHEGARSRARQKRAEAEAKRREAAGLAGEIKATAEQLRIRESLVGNGAASRTSLLELQSVMAEAESRLLAVLGQAESADIAAETIEQEIEQQLAARRAEWARAAADANTELADLEAQIAAERDYLDRLLVRSPIDGVVHSLGAPAPGGVVQPGGLVATIVPSEDRVKAEVRVRPDDIGHVELGGEAFVRVTTFDSERFGEIKGEVSMISPTSFETETGERYFLAELELDRTAAEVDGKRLSLAPGMVVSAEIKTGAKSVLRYLMKPIFRGLERAFSER